MMTLAFVVCAYLLGSVSFAVLMSKLFGLDDPRTYGSGNPGATNVLRSGKKAAAALTLLGDAAKGWLAVVLAMRFAPHDEKYLMLVAAVVLAVFLGHVFPVFLRFKGGKGVATALGTFWAIAWPIGVAGCLAWLAGAAATRRSSVGSLCAMAAGAMAGFVLLAPTIAWALLGVALYVVWRHRANIERLLAGTEPRIGQGR